MNLGHLDFDIVSDLELRISDFASLGIFTTVESALQIRLFMQNKAKYLDDQMYVSTIITRGYGNKSRLRPPEKQSQTNPNKANFKKAKMNVTVSYTRDYENKSPIRAPKKQSQISKRQKPMQTSLPQRIMRKTPLSDSAKTNPNKANFKANIMLLRMMINTRRKSLGYYAGQIEAPNACDRAVVGCRLTGVKPRGRFYLIVGTAWPIIDGSGLRF